MVTDLDPKSRRTQSELGKVDADGGGGIEVAGENGSSDDFCRDAFDFFLLETRIDGAVVFKPLRIDG